MAFTLEVLPAAEGDCLLLHWATAKERRLAVIDGGPGRIFETHLEPRLNEIADERGEDRLPLDLVMVSHMDSDHIIGIKKLIRKVRKQVEQKVQQSFQVRRLWHNVFNDVLGDAIDVYYKTLTASYQASVNGRPNPILLEKLYDSFRVVRTETSDVAEEHAWDIGLILAGHGDGRDLRIDHDFLFKAGLTSALNTPIRDPHGDAALITYQQPPVAVSIDGLAVTILGPARSEIEALQREFDKYIEKQGLTAEVVLAAYADESVKNLSSIVCMVEYEGKRILLTGDARGDKVIEGLQNAAFLATEGVVMVDVLKVPHHGSDRNVAPDFFKRVSANTYVLSGNGKHGNPERDTVAWIVESRPKTAQYRLAFTYPLADIDAKRKLEMDIKNQRRKPENRIEWSQHTNSLQTYIEDRKDAGYAFTCDTGAPIQIELGV